MYNANNGAIEISVAAIRFASFTTLPVAPAEPLSNNASFAGTRVNASPSIVFVVYVSFQLNTNENRNTTSIVEIDNGFAVINKLNETSFLK